jgi:hypothetical protein
MRAFLTVLILTFTAAEAHAQLGVPFAPYEPTPAYLGLGNNRNMNCDSAPAPYPYNREGRRGQSGGDPSPPPGCPTR